MSRIKSVDWWTCGKLMIWRLAEISFIEVRFAIRAAQQGVSWIL